MQTLKAITPIQSINSYPRDSYTQDPGLNELILIRVSVLAPASLFQIHNHWHCHTWSLIDCIIIIIIHIYYTRPSQLYTTLKPKELNRRCHAPFSVADICYHETWTRHTPSPHRWTPEPGRSTFCRRLQPPWWAVHLEGPIRQALRSLPLWKTGVTLQKEVQWWAVPTSTGSRSLKKAFGHESYDLVIRTVSLIG